MGIKIVLNDSKTNTQLSNLTEAFNKLAKEVGKVLGFGTRLESIEKKLIELKEQIVVTEDKLRTAVKDALVKASDDFANALTKEKQELIDKFKAAIEAAKLNGVSDEGFAEVLEGIASLGSTSVAGVDKLSTDVDSSGTPPTP